jgi:hypothetical protein
MFWNENYPQHGSYRFKQQDVTTPQTVAPGRAFA